jgi:hypothetical protein
MAKFLRNHASDIAAKAGVKILRQPHVVAKGLAAIWIRMLLS